MLILAVFVSRFDELLFDYFNIKLMLYNSYISYSVSSTLHKIFVLFSIMSVNAYYNNSGNFIKV